MVKTPDEEADVIGPSSVNAGTSGGGAPSSIPATDTVMCTAGYDHTIKFWHVHTSLCVKTFQHPDSQVNALSITPDRRLVAAAGFQHVRIYDIHSSNVNPSLNFEGLSKNVTTIGFNKDGQWMYSGGEDFSARIWDLRSNSPQCQKVFQTLASPITCATLHPNNTELIVTDQNGTIHVWDLRTDRTEQLIPEQSGSTPVPIQCVAVDPLGKFLAVVNNKGDCYVWKLEGTEISPVFSGLTIPSGTEVEPLRLNPHHKMKAHKRYALKCVFSPDSSLLATTSGDQTAKIWSAKNEQFNLERELSCPGQRWVWDAAFTGDSQYLITASSDNLARLWCLENGQSKREYNGHQKPLICVAFRDPSM